MYCNKENVNILTALLIAAGVKDAVVCPGSRNAPIVNNLSEAPEIRCHPVTDERSAGFYAIGLAQATHRPVVVCVTSGSALLNVAPAVAEAHYQRVPLVVVSADRPQQWIGQLDGQTLPQQGAFGTMARCSAQLPEPRNDEERWLCRRLVSEALLKATSRGGGPVHVNVPISEPLFTFGTEQLPQLAPWRLHTLCADWSQCEALASLRTASRPMVVMGQMAGGALSMDIMRALMQRYVVVAEPLSSPLYTMVHGDEAVRVLDAAEAAGEMTGAEVEAYMPDCCLYVGGTVVSKAVRRFLRRAGASTCFVTPDALMVSDPLMSLADVVECPACGLDGLLATLCDGGATAEADAFRQRWTSLLDRCAAHAESYEPPFSQMAVVRYFESQLDDLDLPLHVHYANSTAVRLACVYAAHYVWCNRGVNGIEGSLSTAAGFSLGTADRVVCVIGDLSFFYDQNALWNQRLRGNLRIILLNNHGGGIFRMLPGLEASEAAHGMVDAAHTSEACGICTQNDIGYLKASTLEEMRIGVVTLLTQPSERPMLLEVFTDADTDARVLKNYYDTL